jgi:hypothetical protein
MKCFSILKRRNVLRWNNLVTVCNMLWNDVSLLVGIKVMPPQYRDQLYNVIHWIKSSRNNLLILIPCHTSLDQLLFISGVLFNFFTKSYLNEEVNCSESFPSVCIPWFIIFGTSSRWPIRTARTPTLAWSFPSTPFQESALELWPSLHPPSSQPSRPRVAGPCFGPFWPGKPSPVELRP